MPHNIPTISTELSIDKALEFVGDNHHYQQKRLFLISIVILTLGILTSRIALQTSSLSLLFLIASGAGQIVCPIKMSLKTISKGVGASALLAMGLYPFGGFIRALALMGVGFFARGFFISSLIYLNEIGGQRFRGWSMLVVFGVWALSTLFNSVDGMLGLGRWQIYYVCVFIPCLVTAYFIVDGWQDSPHYLYFKKQYSQTRVALNVIAFENNHPYLPYELQGQNDEQDIGYKRPVYTDLLSKNILRQITIPLCLIWAYRQYIYYASNLMIPELGQDHSRIYILVSVSEVAAVLISYPVRMNIKRVNSIAGTALLVLLMSILSSFTTVPQDCRTGLRGCVAKTLYFLSLMTIRFGMSLLGLILVNYTLQVYPSNVRRLGFSVCLAVSSSGSICMPWLNHIFIYWGLSGFISFTLCSAAILAAIPKLEETFGRMKIQTLEELQNQSATALKNWALLDFRD